MAKCDAIATEVPEALALYQSVDRVGWTAAGIHWLSPHEGQLRKRSQHSCTVAMATVVIAIGGLPPSLGHVDFSARHRIVERSTSEPAKAEQISSDIACRMIVGQKGDESRCGAAQLVEFGLTKLIDDDGWSAAKSVESIGR